MLTGTIWNSPETRIYSWLPLTSSGHPPYGEQFGPIEQHYSQPAIRPQIMGTYISAEVRTPRELVYSAVRYTNNCFVFQLNNDVKSRQSIRPYR